MSGLVHVLSARGFVRFCAVGLVLLAWPGVSAAAGGCPDRMAAYWKLDEAAGSIFADAAGGLAGSCVGTCPGPVKGKIGNARQFAASSPSRIEAPGAAFDWGAAASFSIELWVKREAGTLSGNEAVVSRTESSGAVSWWAGLGSSGEAAFVLAGAKGNTAQSLRGTKNLANGKWHHVAAIHDGAAGENRLYVDGVLEAAVKAAYPNGFAAEAGTPLAIGGFPGSFFSGTVDEIAIHHRALAEKESRGHYFLVRDYCAPCSLPVKVMPLGDSITAGSSSGVDDPAFQISYRKDLWDRLAREGYSIDYVGSQVAGQGYQASEGFDPDHEGHPGWSDGALANSTYKWVSTYRPEVVLVHAGTNGVDPSPADVERLLNEIDRYSEDVTVVLARIINRVPYSPTTTDFNDNVEAMVRARVAAGDKIIQVDQEMGAGLIYQYLPDGDMWNSLHPYATGYAKMAKVWHAALSSFLPACPAVYPPVITSEPVLAARGGSVYRYDVEASGNPAPGFSLAAAPAGMRIDPATGLIEWMPAGEGSYPVTVEAANSEGADRQSFVISVLPEGGVAAGLVALYHFDRTAGEGDQLVLDFAGNGHHATCGPLPADCPVWTSAGKFGGAFTYDGTNDRFTIPDDPAWDLADFTLAAWVNIRAYPGTDMHILGHRGSGAASRALWVVVKANGNRIAFLRNDAILATSTFTLPTGQWHHVAVTYQAASGTAALYLDGQRVATGIQTGSLYPTANVVDLGLRTAKGDNPFAGMLDEVAVWGRTLAAEEVRELAAHTAGIGQEACGEGDTKSCYSGPGGTEGIGACRAGVQTCSGGQWGGCEGEVLPGQEVCGDRIDQDCDGSDPACSGGDPAAAGLLALYHFDRTTSESDQFVFDFSGQGHNATCGPLTGECPAWTPQGRFEGAFTYDGLDDRFTIPDDPAWDLADFTMAAWVNIRNYTGSDMHILGHRGVTITSRALWLLVSSSKGNRVAFIRNNAIVAISPFTLEAGRWYHVAVTYQGVTGATALYIDGSLAASGVQTGALSSTDNVVDLGFRTAKGDSPFSGMLDEAAVWGRTMTAEEVRDLARRTDGIGMQACVEGQTRPCYSGPAATEGVGVCRPGFETCSSGQWGLCEGEVLPQTEICGDEIDQDCNGSDAVCSGGGGDTAGLLALYHFDRTASESDQVVFDFSGNGHHAACGPLGGECPAWTPAGKFGGAFSYDGIDDRFTIPDDPAWDLADFTMAAWVNVRNYTGSDMHILGHRGAITATRALWLLVSSSKGNRVTFIRNGAIVAISPFTLETGRWYHVAVTYTAATGATALYIDGQLAAAGTQTGSLYSTSNVVDLGFRTAKGDNPFAGMLDEVAVWGRALTAEEIREMN